MALAQALSPAMEANVRTPRPPPALAARTTEMRQLVQSLMQADTQISALVVRDTQGQPLFELRREESPSTGTWGWFVWAVAPLPVAQEAPIPGVRGALASQPPAVRVWLYPPAHDQNLQVALTRLWLFLVLGLALSAPALFVAVRRIARHQQPLLATARALAQGRTEVRAPAQTGINGAIAAALNQAIQHLHALQQHAPITEDSALLRQDLAREKSRLKALEQELHAARELSRQRGSLLGNLAHELRTPLAALSGHADLLMAENLAASSRESLRLLRSSARQLMQLINDLLDWSRIENGQIALTRQSFNLASEIEETLRLLAPLAYDKGLELAQMIYHDVPSTLTGDAVRMRQILNNLLSNAIKFTTHGEVVLRVMKEREEEGRILLGLRVSDTGAGIPPEQMARLFLPYQRLQESNPAGAAGTGLGLAITRHLVERMGGTIKVESEPGQGAHFHVSVWLEASPGATADALPELRGLRVWLADESTAARVALRHRLEWWNMPTTEFDSAAELLSALRGTEDPPDLLIVGLKPASLSDPSLRELAQFSKAGQPLPLLILINAVRSILRDQALTLGATDCLPKYAGGRELADVLFRLSGRAPAPAPIAVLKNRRVLIAENNIATRAYLKALLESLGAQVLEAVDGTAAVELCLAQSPDLALLDLHMPGMDGIDCARQIRARSSRRVPLICISAHLEPEEEDALKLAGIDAVLLKPFDTTQLLRTCEPLLGRAMPSAPASPLSADENLRALLRDELPRQLQEVEAALGQPDRKVAREAIHTLHGTAAFYRLGTLKAAASSVEKTLIKDQAPTESQVLQLRQSADEALQSLM